MAEGIMEVDMSQGEAVPPPVETSENGASSPPPSRKSAPVARPVKAVKVTPSSDDHDDDEELAGERRSRPNKGGADLPKELLEVKARENASLRDIANAFGENGSYKIKVTRVEPEVVRHPVTKMPVKVAGFLRNYSEPIDEEILAQNHGGGKYAVQFMRNNRGSWVFFTQRTVEVVGDPRLDDTFRNAGDAAPAPTPTTPTTPDQNPQLVNKAFDILKEQIDIGRNSHAARGPDPAMGQFVELLKTQLAASNAQVEALRKEMAELRNVKPTEDPFKNMILENLMKDDSARIQAIRAQYDSELRMLKENHQAEIKLIEARWERERGELKQMHQAQVNLMSQTHEIQLQTAKGMYETNMKLAEHENRRLERENGELKSDNKELRAKKEKGALELIKEADQIKEALGVGDDGEKSKLDAVIEAAPGLIEAAKTYFKPPQQQQAGQPQQALQPSRKVFQSPDGQKWLVDEAGNMTPVRKKQKPKPAPQPGPNGEPPIPEIAPETLNTIINYLERAFAGGQDPQVVAQSGRAMVPEEIITAIRDHKVDGFLTKVAKLPSTSPLSSQAGRNWMRKVGEELVGE